MRIIALLAGLAGATLAQDNPADLFNKAPADVDRALRARITEFYTDMVKGEYRKGEALVAEDTKDYYYSGNKPHYLSCELAKIKYSEDFQQAEAVVKCEQLFVLPEFGAQKFVLPVHGLWKLENGQWYWYVDKERLNDSPFGHMTAGQDVPDGAGNKGLPPIATSLDQVYAMVKIDKTEVSLAPGASTQVTISNGMPGPIVLVARTTAPEIEVRVDHSQVNAGEHAVVAIHAKPGAASGTVEIQVQPTGQILAVKTTVQ